MTPPPPPPRRPWWPALGAAALVAIASALAALLYRFDPAGARFYPPCLWHQLTGLHCAGCGGTRAAHALLHLDLATAIRQNSFLVLVALPLLALALLQVALGRGFFSARVQHWLLVGFLILAGLFTVARNLPYAPFHWLAPR
ncbi:MAG: DUF2752 domain-containing protein [Lentisphaeria bacterium]|jgi:hypothetical protein